MVLLIEVFEFVLFCFFLEQGQPEATTTGAAAYTRAEAGTERGDSLKDELSWLNIK